MIPRKNLKLHFQKGDNMNGENIERLQDAWFFLRDTAEDTGSAEVREIADKLHALIDREIEKEMLKAG